MNPQSPSAIAPELAACPFCGGTAVYREGVYTSYVHCLECDMMGPNLDRADAIAAWNRRAPDPKSSVAPEADLRARAIAEVWVYESLRRDFSFYDAATCRKILDQSEGRTRITAFTAGYESALAQATAREAVLREALTFYEHAQNPHGADVGEKARTALSTTSEQAAKMLAVIEAAKAVDQDKLLSAIKLAAAAGPGTPDSSSSIAKMAALHVAVSALTLTTKEPGDDQ